MFSWLKTEAIRLALPKFAPMIGRYLAAAVIGVVAAALNHFKLQIDPALIDQATTALAALFAAIVVAGGYATVKESKHITVGKTVQAAAKDAGVPTDDVIAAAVQQASAANARVEVRQLPDVKE